MHFVSAASGTKESYLKQIPPVKEEQESVNI